MSQFFLDNLTILSLFLAFLAALIIFFVEIIKQQQQGKNDEKQTQSDEIIKTQITKLQNEVNLLKLKIKK